MNFYAINVFFEIKKYKWWGDPKPLPDFIGVYNICISSDKDFETLQKKCLEETKDRYVSARVESEVNNYSPSSVMTEDEFFKRLSKAYLTMVF